MHGVSSSFQQPASFSRRCASVQGVSSSAQHVHTGTERARASRDVAAINEAHKMTIAALRAIRTSRSDTAASRHSRSRVNPLAQALISVHADPPIDAPASASRLVI